MSKLPMTAPSAPAPGTRMATSQPVKSSVMSSDAKMAGKVSGGGSGRSEAFSRGHTAQVKTPAQPHHQAKMRGGNGC